MPMYGSQLYLVTKIPMYIVAIRKPSPSRYSQKTSEV